MTREALMNKFTEAADFILETQEDNKDATSEQRLVIDGYILNITLSKFKDKKD